MAFRIEITKPVIFKDYLGNIIQEFKVGDRITAFSDDGTYFATGMGGIYKDEAKRIEESAAA